MEVLKVSATSKPVAVAGAIAGVIRSKGRVEVQAIGAGAATGGVGAAGAGAGGGVQAVSKSEPIKLPSETVLTFTTQKAVQLP